MARPGSIDFLEWLPVSLLLVSTVALAADAPTTPAKEKDHPPSIPLWPNGAPGFEAKKDLPEVVTWRVEPDITFPVTSGIHNPTITPYLPPKDKATGAAVIIAPGGAHRFLTTDREGYDLGQWLSERGIAGFVLKYRLARDTNSTYQVEVHALADAQRAIRLIRSRAGEWNVNPGAVGILGFSAGGEVAGLAATRYDKGDSNATDPVDRLSSRPDFQVLVYPGGVRNPQLTKETPPALLVCAYDDRANISEGLPEYYLALKKAGVLTELHVYAKGGHGFGVRDRPLAVSGWPTRLEEWLRDLGFLNTR